MILCSAALAIGALSAQQKVTSILEICDITTGERTTVKEFPYLIEAPNWTSDGQWLIYNSGGKLYKLSPDQPGEPEQIETAYAVRCNNDHVLSADGQQIAISHGSPPAATPMWTPRSAPPARSRVIPFTPAASAATPTAVTSPKS